MKKLYIIKLLLYLYNFVKYLTEHCKKGIDMIYHHAVSLIIELAKSAAKYLFNLVLVVAIAITLALTIALIAAPLIYMKEIY